MKSPVQLLGVLRRASSVRTAARGSRSILWILVPVLAIALWLGLLAGAWNQPVTLLLMGSDSRAGNSPSRSDTILVLRADPWSGSLRGLSLPRDLYVPLKGLPVRRTERLNAALFFGDYYSHLEGISAACATVSDLIGVPMDGGIVVHLDLVRNLVDGLGGIDVYCEKPVADPKFGSLTGDKIYPVRFEAGWNYLNGQRALDFLRIRKPDTDFGRMSRNRAFLEGVAARLASPAGLVRLPFLLPRIKEGLSTDIGPIGQLRIAWAMARCLPGGIRWDTIERSEVLPHITQTGAQVLVAEPGILEEAGRILTGGKPVDLAGTPQSSLHLQ
jgi:LCP family protein required for cell wall assembly